MEGQSEQQVEYYKKDHKYMSRLDSAYTRNIFSRVISATGASSDSKILEIGCGAGRFTYTFLKQGYDITGLDISENLLEKLKRSIKPGMKITLLNMTAEEAAKSNSHKFDFVIGFHVLHHIEALASLMKACFTMLKPGGKLMFIEPNPFGPLFYAQVLLERDISWEGEKGILNITPKKITTILRESGFIRPAARRFGIFPPALQGLPFSRHADSLASNVPLANYLLIFQAITAEKPKSSS
jgi:2-polyprenyl-3-methyl-5-hydroxy-6-metoxy-1,4-benzoquinol methylase